MRWLHLSDLHYNSKMCGRSTSELRDALPNYLREEQITADYLFLTGDYRHAGYWWEKKEEAAKASSEFILTVAQAANISPANIYMVPGNHDLDRTPNRRKIKQIQQKYDVHDGRIEEDDLEFLLNRFTFFQYINQELIAHGVKDIWSEKLKPLHTYRCFDEFSLLFLNTCLICNSDKDRGRLVIGNYELRQALEEIKQNNPDKPIIILAHHGLNNFKREEQAEVEKILGDYPVLLYLCGDAHELWARKIENFMEYTMGCLVQGRSIHAAFAIGELGADNSFSIEAHQWDAHTSEWGEYTQFNRKFMMWRPRISKVKLSLTEVVTKDRPALPSPYFQGENLKVREAENALSYERIVLLCGIGGIGKTEICRFLFEKYAVKSGSDTIKKIGWIKYQNTLKNSFFLQFTGIVSDSIEPYWLEVESFTNTLGGELLLIIDNADDITEQEIMMLQKLGCRIILTAKKSMDRIKVIEVEPLPIAECRKLYRKYSGAETAEDSMIDAVTTLAARHTLAVELLAKLQYYAGMTVERLYEELQKNDFNLPEVIEQIPYCHNPEENSDEIWYKSFTEHMNKIFDLSQIRRNPKELKVMQLCSLLEANFPISVETIKDWMELENLNDINTLAERRWLIRSNCNEEPSLMIHPLIASLVRDRDMPMDEVTDALIRKVNDAIKIKTTETYIDKLNILPHAEAIAKHASVDTNNYIILLGYIAGIYLHKAEYKKALHYYERALELQKVRSGEISPEIAKIYNAIAAVYDAQGNYDDATVCLKKGLEVNRNLYGEKGLNTAMSYSNLSIVFFKLNDYDEARRLLSEALKIQECVSAEILAKENVSEEEFLEDKASIYVNKGYLSYRFGEWEPAMQWYNKALAIRKKIYGPESPNVATVYGNIAAVYHAQRKCKYALAQYEIVKKIYEDKVGTEHPNTAQIYKNIANVYFDMRKYRKALFWYNEAFVIQQKVLGMNHPSISYTYNQLGITYYHQGKYEQAIDCFQSAYETALKTLGKSHPHTRTVCYSIAKIYLDLGNIPKCKEWQKKLDL